MIKKIVRKIYFKYYNSVNPVVIKSMDASLKASYGKGCFIDKGTVVAPDVVIGDYSYVNRNSYIENCTIGKFCSISSGVYISPKNHEYNYISSHPFLENPFYGFVKAGRSPMGSRKKVKIGNDVWIGLNAIILEGVEIGDGAVIAAGSVVTKNVNPYEIVGGVPSKHLKYRFSNEEIKIIQDKKWWDWKKDRIKDNIESFYSIEKFKGE